MEKDYQKLYYHALGRMDGTLDLLDVALGIMKDGIVMMKQTIETNKEMIQDINNSSANSLNAAMEMINQSCLRFDLLSQGLRNIQQKDADEHGLNN